MSIGSISAISISKRRDGRHACHGASSAPIALPAPAARADRRVCVVASILQRKPCAEPRNSCSMPALWAEERPVAASRTASRSLTEKYKDFLTARKVDTSSGRFGYLRIWSFDVNDDQEFIEAAIKLLAGLPNRGLIIDLRDNPGGLIWAAERMLQLFTPNPIAPTKFGLRATPLTNAMAAARFNQGELGPWADSIASAPCHWRTLLDSLAHHHRRAVQQSRPALWRPRCRHRECEYLFFRRLVRRRDRGQSHRSGGLYRTRRQALEAQMSGPRTT